MRSTLRLLAAACCLAVGSAHAAPVTDIVFGNLGSAGTNALDEGSVAQIGGTVPSGNGDKYAIAFTTGSNTDYLKLNSVTLGLGDVSPFSTAILKIVADNAGSPTGSQLATQSLVVGANGLYDFSLGAVTLSANTQYWVTLEAQDPGNPSFFNWLRNADTVSPTAQNGSDYSFPTGGSMRNLNNAGWSNYASGAQLSISVHAVPEPSTYALAAAGLGVAGLVRARRRKALV